MLHLCSSSLHISLSLAINPSTLRTERGERGKNVWGAFGSISEAQKQALQQTQQLKRFQLQTRARCFTLPSDLRMRQTDWERCNSLGSPGWENGRSDCCVGRADSSFHFTHTCAYMHTTRQRGWERNRLSWPQTNNDCGGGQSRPDDSQQTNTHT